MENDLKKQAEKAQQMVKATLNQSQTLVQIKTCKYLLPCGKCDKTDLMCSQYHTI